jgi:hypothetical protein
MLIVSGTYPSGGLNASSSSSIARRLDERGRIWFTARVGPAENPNSHRKALPITLRQAWVVTERRLPVPDLPRGFHS